MEVGIYKDLNIVEYHAHKESVSRSALNDFAVCPKMYWAMHLNPNRPPKKITPAMIFGSAYHTLILEPGTFFDRYVVEPEAVKLKDVGREAYDEYKAVCAELEITNKIVLTAKDFYTLSEMALVLRADSDAYAAIEGAIYEQSYFWKDEDSGLLVKSRPDALHDNMIVDLKTIDDATSHRYQAVMTKGGYHVQGAMIRDARRALEDKEVSNVINIVQEKTYPYLVGIKIIDEYALDAGEEEYKQQLIDLAHCREHNDWPGLTVESVTLPRWKQ